MTLGFKTQAAPETPYLTHREILDLSDKFLEWTQNELDHVALEVLPENRTPFDNHVSEVVFRFAATELGCVFTNIVSNCDGMTFSEILKSDLSEKADAFVDVFQKVFPEQALPEFIADIQKVTPVHIPNIEPVEFCEHTGMPVKPQNTGQPVTPQRIEDGAIDIEFDVLDT